MIRASDTTYHTWLERGHHQVSSGDNKDKDKDTHKHKYKDKDRAFKKESLPVYINLVLMRSNRYIQTRSDMALHLTKTDKDKYKDKDIPKDKDKGKDKDKVH